MTMPTTGEFGPRGGQGDFEFHTKPATRFGVSFVNCRENVSLNSSVSGPDETQIRYRRYSVLPDRRLAPGVTVIETNYNMGSVDLGFKYQGLELTWNFSGRRLSDFEATGPLPISVINDYGYVVQISK